MKSPIVPALVASLALGACQPEAPATAAPRAEARRAEDVITLSEAAMRRADIRVGVVERRALGGGAAIPAEVQFEPTSTAHVGPLVPGRFTRVSVALGDSVRRGQLLGVIESGDVSAARSRLEQARARLQAAEAALSRQRQLTTEGIGAQRALIDAEAQVAELRAEVQGVERQLSVFGSGRAGSLELVAPIDGVVVAIHATLGDTASAEQAAFVVTDPTRVWVRGNVPELEIAHVAAGMRVVVRLHAFEDVTLPGTVTYVAPALDDATRSLPIRVTLERPDERLRSGLYGTIELVGDDARSRPLVVPIDGVATLEGQTVVFVPGDAPGTFRARAVALGRRVGELYEVRDGLTEGERVALSGAFTMKSTFQRETLREGHGE